MSHTVNHARVVVTGARGFVGRQVVRRLAELDEVRVTAVDAELDLRDGEGVRALIQTSRPSLILHLGGISGPMVSVDDPVQIAAVNAVGTVALLDAAVRLTERPRVVLASSIAVVEHSVGEPTTVYAATKRFVEDVTAPFVARGLPVIRARLGSVYGAGRTTQHIITDFARSIAFRGQAEFDPAAVEPLVHVRDAARLLVALGLCEWPQTMVHTLVQRCVPHGELAALVGEALGISYRSHPITGPHIRWSEPLNSAPLLRETGLRFVTRITDGVPEMARAAVRAA